MEGYKTTIKFVNTELTNKERVKIKDTTNAVKLDEAISENSIRITPTIVAELAIHNEKSENKEYSVYIVSDKDGTKYVTSSQSFWSAFNEIASEMGDEEYEIEVYKKESKNYKGKYFITCSLV